MRKTWILIILFGLISACKNGQDEDPGNLPIDDGTPEPCELGPCVPFDTSYPTFDLSASFNSWSASSYILPFRAGNTHQVLQGNSGDGHSGVWQFGYDILMCEGTDVIAARAGTVVLALDGAKDTTWQGVNLILISHNDGTVAYYSNLMLNGVLVNVGDVVGQGELIAKSGSGFFGGPQLHFSVHECADLPGLPPDDETCNSLPVNFSNTIANPHGLGSGRCYDAL